MLKKSIPILLIILLLGGVVYLYHRLSKEEIPANAAIKAIPMDASFIFESRKTLPLWKNISQSSDMWKDIIEAPYFSELNGQINSIDSIIRESSEMSKILDNQPLFISAHSNGMNRFSYLFISSVPEVNLQSKLSAFLNALKENDPTSDLHYEENTIHCIKIDKNNSFYYTISNGIFISSFAPTLIEESLRQMESGISLVDNSYFTKVLNASGGQAEANLFINFQTCTNVSSHLVSKSFLATAMSVQNFGQWMELDITINPDEVVMTGFANCDSAGNQFLNLFQHQAAREIRIASVVPSNTAFMVCHEFSDYGVFHKEYLKYLGAYSKNRGRLEWVNRVQTYYGLNIEKYFYPWINNEVAQIITEPLDSTLQNDTYVLVQAADVKTAMNKLNAFADTVAAKKEIKAIDTTYMHHEIHNMDLDNVTGNLLGSSFSGVTKSWYTSVGDYIVFANSMNALKTYIYQYEGNNILENDSYYKDYIKEHVQSAAGIYIYNNMALSPVVYAKYLDNIYAGDIKKYKSAYSKFHAASIQFSNMQGMFYTNIYWKRNPMYRKDLGPLWQTALDTSLAIAPVWVADYITHKQFVLAQDKNENVYLINSAGHIEWKKKIEEDIQSPIYEVDAMKNKKLQYLFNTSNNIVLLDRKGNEGEGFPIRLKYSASAPLAVLDYDNNKKYRLLLPGDDLKIHEYDISGKPVNDWVLPKTKEIVKCPAHHCLVSKTDYLIFIDDGGIVYALDRKGNEKLNLNNRMPPHIKSFYITQGKSLSDSYIMTIDSLGTVFKLSLSGELSTISYLKSTYNNLDFVPASADSSGKQEMLFLNGSDLYAYNMDKTKRFRISLKNEDEKNISIFTFPDHSLKIGVVDKRNEKIYLWDNLGEVYPGFPLYGSEKFSIADMKNDGSLYIVTGADNKVYVYSAQ